MTGQTRCFQRDVAAADAPAQFAIQFVQRAVAAKQRGQPLYLFALRLRALFQFAHHDAKRIGRHAGMKRGVAFQFRHRTLLDEGAYRRHQFQHGGLIHHGQISPRMIRLTRSISVSEDRRPMAARSTDPSMRKP